MYSAKQAINCRVQVDNVSKKEKRRLEEDFARALLDQNGNNVAKLRHTEDWQWIVMKAKQDLQGHFEAEVIHRARFEIG
jgi:hypothetical protein